MATRRLGTLTAFLMALAFHLLAGGALLVLDRQEWLVARMEPPEQPRWIELEKLPILINPQNRPRPADAPPPRRATVLSDRNQSVEREQRARENGVPSLRDLAPSVKESREGPGFSARKELARIERGGEGGSQRLDLPDIPEGAENILNTRESVFYSFYARMYSAIAPVWQGRIRSLYPGFRLDSGRYVTRVEVVLDPSGAVESVRLLSPSSIRAFDELAVESWSRITRFPNPPEGLRDRRGRVSTTWSFTVEVDQGSRMIYLPPRRG